MHGNEKQITGTSDMSYMHNTCSRGYMCVTNNISEQG